jgi:hypothetical protein
MVTIFFTHVHVLQKAYMFFTTVVKNAYAFKDDDCICRMCEARFRKSLEMSHDTEETSSKRTFRKYDTAIDTSTHVHVLQKAYMFFTTVIIFCSMERKFTWVK